MQGTHQDSYEQSALTRRIDNSVYIRIYVYSCILGGVLLMRGVIRSTAQCVPVWCVVCDNTSANQCGVSGISL